MCLFHNLCRQIRVRVTRPVVEDPSEELHDTITKKNKKTSKSFHFHVYYSHELDFAGHRKNILSCLRTEHCTFHFVSPAADSSVFSDAYDRCTRGIEPNDKQITLRLHTCERERALESNRTRRNGKITWNLSHIDCTTKKSAINAVAVCIFSIATHIRLYKQVLLQLEIKIKKWITLKSELGRVNRYWRHRSVETSFAGET